MRRADAALRPAALRNANAGSAQHHVEVHAVDADGWVVLDAQVDVLLDAEPEVAGVREVLAVQLVFLDLMNKDEAINQYNQNQIYILLCFNETAVRMIRQILTFYPLSSGRIQIFKTDLSSFIVCKVFCNLITHFFLHKL